MLLGCNQKKLGRSDSISRMKCGVSHYVSCFFDDGEKKDIKDFTKVVCWASTLCNGWASREGFVLAFEWMRFRLDDRFPQQCVGVLLGVGGCIFPHLFSCLWKESVCCFVKFQLFVKGISALFCQILLTPRGCRVFSLGVVRCVLDLGCLFLPSSGCLRAVYSLHPWWLEPQFWIVVSPVDTQTYQSFSKVQGLCIFTVVLFGQPHRTKCHKICSFVLKEQWNCVYKPIIPEAKCTGCCKLSFIC